MPLIKDTEKPTSSKAVLKRDSSKAGEKPSGTKAEDKPSCSKAEEKPGCSKPATIKVKSKAGKKKLENKRAQTDLLAKKAITQRRSRSSGGKRKKGKKVSGSRSSSLPPYPKYDFEKYLEKTDPNKVLAQWLEREHTPLDDWEIVGTVVKVPREVNANEEEENADAESTGSDDDEETKPKLNQSDKTIKPKSEILGAQNKKTATAAIGETKVEGAVDKPKAEEAVANSEHEEVVANTGPVCSTKSDDSVTEAKEGAGERIVVLHKMKSLSKNKIQSSDEEYE